MRGWARARMTNQAVKEEARHHRREQTEAERILWARLRNRQLQGWKFRRQYPIGNYIVDFCCPELGLVIELDGGQHASRMDEDKKRTEILTGQGYQVLRFWNNEVLRDTNGVLEVILGALKENPSPPLSPPRGRGERLAGGHGLEQGVVVEVL